MKLKVKDMDIATGGVSVIILNEKDATRLDLHPLDRLWVKKGKKSTIAVLDIAESRKACPPGRIGMFEEVLDALKAKHNDVVEVALAEKPVSFEYIRKKLTHQELSDEEIMQIVQDIVGNKLTEIELTTFVIANYMAGMSIGEIVALTKAMTETGDVLGVRNKVIADLHSIGGVPGNRTTMITVPIVVAAGVKMPKTSSRAITSAAGTADTMEVLAKVSLSKAKLKNMLKTIGGFIVWGGAINLAPADEKIITVEHPISIDAEGQMIASIMAKKASVNATHLTLEIPYGQGAKIAHKKDGERLGHLFQVVGRKLGIKVDIVLTDGSEPIGNGIGPVLEARDVLWVLLHDLRGPLDLKEKSIMLAARILEGTGKVEKREGKRKARALLESGKAYDVFLRMIKAQGGKEISPEQLRPGKYAHHVKAGKTGVVTHIDNDRIAKIARLAGAPKDKGAGIYLFMHKGDKVRKGDILFAIYAHNQQELDFAVAFAKKQHTVMIV